LTHISVCFFRDPAPPALYTLSLHDALPISKRISPGFSQRSVEGVPRRPAVRLRGFELPSAGTTKISPPLAPASLIRPSMKAIWRSEEHTSELQSRFDLVCRLLLEKKKKKTK